MGLKIKIPEKFCLSLKGHFDRMDNRYKLDGSKPLTQGKASQKSSGRTK